MTDEEKAAAAAEAAKEADKARAKAKEAEEDGEEGEEDLWENVRRLDRKVAKLQRESRAAPNTPAVERSASGWKDWVLPILAIVILATVAILERTGKIKWPTRSPNPPR